MKRFLIKYRRQNTPQDAWHRDIAEFIAALDADPRCRERSHIAA
jgi:hypothetical protein